MSDSSFPKGKFAYSILNEYWYTLDKENKKKLEILVKLYVPNSIYEAKDIIFHHKKLENINATIFKKTFLMAMEVIFKRNNILKELYPSEKIKILYKHIDLIQRLYVKENEKD